MIIDIPPLKSISVAKMYMRHRLYSDEDSKYTPLETPFDDA